MFSVCFPQVDRLKAELMYERRTSEEHLSRFEDERRVWQEEKEKVKKRKKEWGYLDKAIEQIFLAS